MDSADREDSRSGAHERPRRPISFTLNPRTITQARICSAWAIALAWIDGRLEIVEVPEP
jgi:hypothetical protein